MEPQVVQLPAIELVERMRLSRIDEGREISERVVIQQLPKPGAPSTSCRPSTACAR